MELREFVAETMIAIIDGVNQTINRMSEVPGKERVGRINPVFPNNGGKIDWAELVEHVEFDVAVTTTDGTSKSGKGGIKVLSFGELGGNLEARAEHSTISRIKFRVPVLLPAQASSPYTSFGDNVDKA